MTQQLITTSGTLITQSIDRIKKYEPKEGYYLAFSGGKDSIVCYDLLEKAGVDFEAHHAVTTMDPKEVGIFIREYYPEVERHHPTYKGKPTNFYQLVSLKGLPSRKVRWCCHYLKEVGGSHRTVVTGIRRAESAKRSGRLEYQKFGNKMMFSPIVDWKDADVWDHIHDTGLPYPSLYDNGHDRIGCIMCPLMCVHKRIRDYCEHESHVHALERAIEVFLSTRPDSGLWNWGENPQQIILSWITSTPATDDSGQCNLGGSVR